MVVLSSQLVSSSVRLNYSLCDKSYTDRKGLSRHLRDSHPEKGDDTGSLLCPLCYWQSEYAIIIIIINV